MSDVKDTVKNILDSRREFIHEVGDEHNSYFIANPTGEDIRKSDWNYAKVFNQAMADGFPTQAQMIETLKERGILSEEYTRELKKTQLDLGAALYRLEAMSDGLDDFDKESIALEVARLRDELFRLNQKVNGPMGNTCENLAEDARNEYLASRIVQKRDGTKVWPKFEDYLSESDTTLMVKARFEVMLWMNGLDSNFLEKTPEQEAMREIAERRLNEALAVANVPPVAETAETPQVENLALPDEPKVSRRGRKKKA